MPQRSDAYDVVFADDADDGRGVGHGTGTGDIPGVGVRSGLGMVLGRF